MSVPLQQLEDMAPGTGYVNVLTTYPEYRWRGFGRGHRRGRRQIRLEHHRLGCDYRGAHRLYERQGYIERAKRPMVKNGWRNLGANWVLRVKDQQAAGSPGPRAGVWANTVSRIGAEAALAAAPQVCRFRSAPFDNRKAHTPGQSSPDGVLCHTVFKQTGRARHCGVVREYGRSGTVVRPFRRIA